MSDKLHKVLAESGLGSRREMERWIVARRVSVNGKIASIGDRVEEADRILVDGKPLPSKTADRLRIVLYNKPEGEICTRRDPEGRPTVFAKLPTIKSGRWIAIGRLDINTSGLILFTNSGALANRLMHPSSNVDREYLVRVHGPVNEEMLARLREGVDLEDGVARFKSIKIGLRGGANQWFTVIIDEGKQREVRRLWESQGVEVSRLKRIRFATVEIPSYVRRGDWMELPLSDTNKLCASVGFKDATGRPPPPGERVRQERHVNKLRGRGGRSR